MNDFDKLAKRLDDASTRHAGMIEVFFRAEGPVQLNSRNDDAMHELESLCNEAASLLRASGIALPAAKDLGDDFQHWTDQLAVLAWMMPRVPTKVPDPFSKLAPRDTKGGLQPGWRTTQDNIFRAVAMALNKAGTLGGGLSAAQKEQEPIDDRLAAKKPAATATTWLRGWKEITAALQHKYNRHREIKRLNATFSGPIKSAGSGTKPIVDRAKLIQWWDSLAQIQQELANETAGKKISAETQHAYGRQGTVAPEIGGEMKKRRKDKRT